MNPQNSSRSSGSQARPPQHVPPSTLELLQVILFSLSLPAFFLNKSLHLIIAGHLASIIHYHNMPKLTAEYWRRIVLDDNFHSISYAFLFLIVPSSVIWIVPAYIGTLIYIPGILLRSSYLPQIYRNVLTKIENSKMQLLQIRADSESWLGFVVTFLWIFGFAHWLLPVLFWQYTRVRYELNYFSKVTFGNVRMKGDMLVANIPMLKSIWEKLVSFLGRMG